jgi:hypothetical protein
MDTKKRLFQYLQPGGVYRRSDLEEFSTSIDRDLAELVHAQVLVRVWRGIYECPMRSQFGLLPPDPHKLVKAFLRTATFCLSHQTTSTCLALARHSFTTVFGFTVTSVKAA